MKPWPNGSGIVVPRSVVWTVVILLAGAMGGLAIQSERLVERVAALVKIVESVEKQAHTNSVDIAELRGQINAAVGGKR